MGGEGDILFNVPGFGGEPYRGCTDIVFSFLSSTLQVKVTLEKGKNGIAQCRLSVCQVPSKQIHKCCRQYSGCGIACPPARHGCSRGPRQRQVSPAHAAHKMGAPSQGRAVKGGKEEAASLEVTLQQSAPWPGVLALHAAC